MGISFVIVMAMDMRSSGNNVETNPGPATVFNAIINLPVGHCFYIIEEDPVLVEEHNVLGQTQQS